MKGKGGQREDIIFNFFGKTTDSSENLDTNLIELGFEYDDRIPGPLLFPFHKNH